MIDTPRPYTLRHFRHDAAAGVKRAMLTVYDFTTAALLEEAGIPMLLVGDSAAQVILGHSSTRPISLAFMIELTAAVRRGAPHAWLMADMPFGTYGGDAGQGAENVFRMAKESGCDCVKLEVTAAHVPLVEQLSAVGVAVCGHLGLRPQTSMIGGYRAQGRTAVDAMEIVTTARALTDAGASCLLLEAVPPAVSEAVTAAVSVPVIGCGGGPACHAHVVVLQDLLALTRTAPGVRGKPAKFVPGGEPLDAPFLAATRQYAQDITEGRYPAATHQYDMPADEQKRFHDLLHSA